MLVSSIIGAAGALGSAIYGAIKSSKANNEARKLIAQQKDENRQWYNTKMNQDYTQRADVQRAIEKQRELLDENMKRASAQKVVGGGSDEAAALAKDSANKSVADATADIAAEGAKYKDQVEQQYRAKEDALTQQEIQSQQQQAAQTAAAAGQAVSAGLGMIDGESLGSIGGKATPAADSMRDAALSASKANTVPAMDGSNLTSDIINPTTGLAKKKN